MTSGTSTESRSILLIDTHYWLWLALGNVERAGVAAIERMSRAADGGRLMVSVISAWEVGLLAAKGRLVLSEPCDLWVKRALSMPGLQLAPLTPEIAVDSSFLPGDFHGDPGDRMIVATARRTGAHLLTRDRYIREYAEQGYLTLADM